jgi:hypothetical protein
VAMQQAVVPALDAFRLTASTSVSSVDRRRWI